MRCIMVKNKKWGFGFFRRVMVVLVSGMSWGNIRTIIILMIMMMMMMMIMMTTMTMDQRCCRFVRFGFCGFTQFLRSFPLHFGWGKNPICCLLNPALFEPAMSP